MRTEKKCNNFSGRLPLDFSVFEAIKTKFLNEKNLSLASTQGSEIDRLQFRLQVEQDSEKRLNIV